MCPRRANLHRQATANPTHRRLSQDQRGVSDVLGNILLISITVVVAGALIFMVMKELVPNSTIHADLDVKIKDADDSWNTGNEQVWIEHRGGEAIVDKETVVRVLLGSNLSTFTGADLGGAFEDGTFEIGEVWVRNFTIASGTTVGVDVIGRPGTGGSIMLATDLVTIAGSGPLNPAPDGFTYASSHIATRGTVAGFQHLQSADPAEATLAEATPAPSTVTLNANGVASASGGWTNANNGFTLEGGEAFNSNNSPGTLQYRHADQTGNPGAITSVVLHARASISSHVDDGFTLIACGGALCTAASNVQGGSSAWVVLSWDVTDLNPAGGAWSWSQVNALESRITPVKAGSRDGAWRIDWAYIDVGYAPSQYGIDIRLDFSGVPDTGARQLELQYRVLGETFSVQVFDGRTNAWNTRGTALNAGASNLWSVSLSADEFNGGAPRIRFLDANPFGATQGRLFLDYARVNAA